MNFTILAVVTFIAWTMLLLLALAVYRTVWSNKSKSASLKFDPSGQGIGQLGERITRAHANCYESAVFVIGPLLLALATDSAFVTNDLALFIVSARVIQSIVHIFSTSNFAVSLRFVFFLIQVGISAYFLLKITIKFI